MNLTENMRIFAAGLVVGGLVVGGLGAGALGTVTAQPDDGRRAVNLPGRTAANPLFSDAIQVGDTLYLPAGSASTPRPGPLPPMRATRPGSCSTRLPRCSPRPA